MINLYEETMEYLAKEGLPEPKFCKCQNKKLSWERYCELARATYYHEGYGCPEIDGSLQLHWHDRVAFRVTYDGAEWFEILDITEPEEEYDGDTLTDGKSDYHGGW